MKSARVVICRVVETSENEFHLFQISGILGYFQQALRRIRVEERSKSFNKMQSVSL